MSRTISVKCTNVINCGHVNVFNESDLVGSVPLIGRDGSRLPPPPVEVDENTIIKCDQCGYPVSCKHAKFSD